MDLQQMAIVLTRAAADVQSIAVKIQSTNNGKLMLKNLTPEEKNCVPGLVEVGVLKYVTFMQAKDSIRLSKQFNEGNS